MRQISDVTVLIVDDETALRKALVFDFNRLGFKVLDAGSGKEAFELVQNNAVDVVITDVRMPGGDGVELLDRIKARDPCLPVVMFVTGYADISLEDAYDKGADAVFPKPFDRKRLHAAVMKAITDKEIAWGSRSPEPISVEFEIDLEFRELNLVAPGRVLSIGRGGIFVALQGELPDVETRGDFRIRIERGDLSGIEGSGVIRWIRNRSTKPFSRGCGIEFEYLSDDCRKRLIDLISELKTKAFIPKA